MHPHRDASATTLQLLLNTIRRRSARDDVRRSIFPADRHKRYVVRHFFQPP